MGSRRVQFIDPPLLDRVSAQARECARQRKNYNFHERDTALAHRLLNAIEPGSYVVPHRHLDPEKEEMMIVLRGRLGILIFTDDGRVEQNVLLEAGGNCGISIPSGVYHSVLAGEPGTVMFECKAGPYRPLTAEEFAPWAPAEGSVEAAVYADSLRAWFAGFAAPAR